MKIIGFSNGHDAAYGILDNGLPSVHNELERFNREKGCKGDSIKLFLENETMTDFTYHTTHRTGNITKYTDSLSKVNNRCPKSKMYISGHHQAHAANAFYTSPYKNALVVTIDGGGVDFLNGQEVQWKDLDDHTAPGSIVTSFTIWNGIDNKIEPIHMFDRGNINIGLYWDTCTYHIFGLNRNPVKRGEEGTVMGMAAFGNPDKYLKYFRNLKDARLTKNWGPYDINFLAEEANKSEQNKFDIAAALQKETETVLYDILTPYIEKYKPENICLSGGVSLNCVAMGKMLNWFPGINIFCDPIPHDAGLTIGSCRYIWHHIHDNPRIYNNPKNHTPYLGQTYSKDIIDNTINEYSDKLVINKVDDEYVINEIIDKKIISIFGGGSESGKRALGNRSILADPRYPEIKDIVNEKVKHRQWFRPFAPSILREEVTNWFINDVDSPYMSFAIPFKPDKIKQVPAVVHHDGTARLQTVKQEDNPWYYNFIKKFKEKTGVPILLNTSFNDREPIVETPKHAINCFLNTNIDYLYFRDHGILLSKK